MRTTPMNYGLAFCLFAFAAQARSSDKQPVAILECGRAYVSHLAFSPDGKTLVSCHPSPPTRTAPAGTCEIRLWDVSARRERARITIGDRLEWPIFSPGSKLLLTRQSQQSKPGTSRTVRYQLWHTATGKPVKLPKTEVIRQAAFSADGRWLATLNSDGILTRWNLRRGLRNGTSLGQIENVSDVRLLHFAPNGNSLVLATPTQIQLWDMQRVRLRARIDGRGTSTPASGWRPNRPGRLIFSPDSTLLASGGQPKTIQIRDVATGKVVQSLKSGNSTSGWLRFSTDSRTLCSAGGEIEVWNVQTGKRQCRIRAHSYPGPKMTPETARHGYGLSRRDAEDLWRKNDFLLHMRFAANDRTLITTGRHSCNFWSVKNGDRTATHKLPSPLVIGVSSDGNRAATVHVTHPAMTFERAALIGLRKGPIEVQPATIELTVWDTRTGQRTTTTRISKTLPVYPPIVLPRVAITPDWKLIAVAMADGSITLWPVAM